MDTGEVVPLSPVTVLVHDVSRCLATGVTSVDERGGG
jgi:hypothetical protein